MAEREPLIAELREGHRRFLELVESVRPELHRYCARMTGSITEGEDIVQDTLARAYYALSEMEEIPPLRPWLFRIAHNRALDVLRRYDRRMAEPLTDDLAAVDLVDPEDALARDEALRAAVSRFVKLPRCRAAAWSSRMCWTIRSRRSRRCSGRACRPSRPPCIAGAHGSGPWARRWAPPVPVRAGSPTVARYVALFNARDWDGVRAMLLDDVRLDLVSRAQRTGRRQVDEYFTKYAGVSAWHLVPGWLDGREVLAVLRGPRETRPAYFIELTVVDERIAAIRDYHFVPYVARAAAMELASPR